MNDDNFGIDKKNKDGFNTLCKTCQKEINHRNYMKNREDRLRKSNEYRENNLEHCREYDRMRYQRDKDHRNATSKIWCSQNSDYVSERLRKYINNHPEKRRKYTLNRKKKNHKISSKEWTACKEYFKDEDGDYCCAYCGLKIQDHYKKYSGKLKNIDLHKEHVDDEGVNDLSNCIPACGSCNSKKWNFDFGDWYNPENPIYSKERNDRIMQWLNDDYKLYIEEKKTRKPYKRKINLESEVKIWQT